MLSEPQETQEDLFKVFKKHLGKEETIKKHFKEMEKRMKKHLQQSNATKQSANSTSSSSTATDLSESLFKECKQALADYFIYQIKVVVPEMNLQLL